LALIIDSGPLVALLDVSDPGHTRCAALLSETRELRIVPVCVLVEAEYRLRSWPDAFPLLLRQLASGAMQLLELPPLWLLRVADLLERYRALPLGLVDATVVAATEMLREPKLVTLDQRHFSVVRPAHVSSLTLLP
jgi:predicted nucleic acid-binding protein